MSIVSELTAWLKKQDVKLSWTRVGGDEPPVEQDRLYINRSEGYEIRDFILSFFEQHNIDHTEKNYDFILHLILGYEQGKKIKTDDLRTYIQVQSLMEEEQDIFTF